MSLLKRFNDQGVNVSFIGAGNLAWHLAPALDNAGFAVREVYSRNKKAAAALAAKLYQAEVKKSLDFSNSASQIFIIAVTDAAIGEIIQEIALPPGVVLAHTSGSQPLSVLSYAATLNTGVFYPLQTFSKKKKVDLKEVPFFIESEDINTEKMLMAMAKAIGKKVYTVSSKDRKALHIAAVFASNFTNHMLNIAADIMEKHGLNFDLLKPLIVETLNKSLEIGPEEAQTGPAMRGDVEILDRHMAFLAGNQQLAEIYKVISQHILDRYHS